MNWREFLTPYQAEQPALFGDRFLERWGASIWQPNDDDRTAAAILHMQIVSRISTQRLAYLDGVEDAALTSVYSLFPSARSIVDAHPKCAHFEALAWEVLNTHVRPFTAKWHRDQKREMLSALDATDEFRAQLLALQPVLRRFDDLLLHLRDNRPAPPLVEADSKRDSAIEDEMGSPLTWGIPRLFGGGICPTVADGINDAESQAVQARREHYDIDKREYATGLALSGGGIRSATFSLGVLVALSRRGLLPDFDYLSSVSGGGYLAAFLSAFLQSSAGNIGLRPSELPFRRDEGEAAALRHIRHYSRYLASGSHWQRLKMIFAQLYGMSLNSLAIIWCVAIFVALELSIRGPTSDAVASKIGWLSKLALIAGVLAALLAGRFTGRVQLYADSFVAGPALILLAVLCWQGLGVLHRGFAGLHTVEWGLNQNVRVWIAVLGAILLVASAIATALRRLNQYLGVVLVIFSAIAAPLSVFGIYLAMYQWASVSPTAVTILGHSVAPIWFAVAGGALLYPFLDINFTSPHRHYRNCVAETFLISPSSTPVESQPFEKGVSVRLSELGAAGARSPYHLINCALNVPASKNPAMQGRSTDFFIFSPKYSGSPLTGYQLTTSWEAADAHLDLGTAMAISGAAAAPQMGLGTMKRFSFWLALLNVRLGYWAARPGKNRWAVRRPGIWYLLQEMRGTMDERGRWLNLSDGGHIENLGVYELLRRRCKYIVAVDGEHDAKMTFHALTNLQRLAAIDLGVRIDIDLDDLRLGDRGFSRSHFRFCRIRYPKDGRGSEDQFGYLLYVKLSLTGNEGEFLRRFRLDEPAFPHHSTGDQFFSETQFEAYRNLGEHIGDKLFMQALVGKLAESTSLDIEAWFQELGKNLLDPLPARA